jgi:hypothetical protein
MSLGCAEELRGFGCGPAATIPGLFGSPVGPSERLNRQDPNNNNNRALTVFLNLDQRQGPGGVMVEMGPSRTGFCRATLRKGSAIGLRVP